MKIDVDITAFRTNKTEKAFSLIGLRMNDKVLMTACCNLLHCVRGQSVFFFNLELTNVLYFLRIIVQFPYKN